MAENDRARPSSSDEVDHEVMHRSQLSGRGTLDGRSRPGRTARVGTNRTSSCPTLKSKRAKRIRVRRTTPTNRPRADSSDCTREANEHLWATPLIESPP